MGNVGMKKHHLSIYCIDFLHLLIGVQCRPVDCFSKPGAYITHNATKSLSDITGGNLSDYMQAPLEPQKALYHFYICCPIPPDL